ncbi:MAG: hypothetical protein RJB01_947 [Actinomycetota bacterium]|jgi:uncharacterized membrane protein
MTQAEALPVPTAADARHRGAFIEMLVSSAIGLVASFVLSVDALILAADPNAIFSCDINTKISCGTVGTSWQANFLGFPNAYLGLITEPIVITLAVAALGGVRFPRWFMNTAQVFYAIGFLFAYWLFYQSYFYIGALCPWCLTITVTTTLVFGSMTRVNILDGNLRFGRYTETIQGLVRSWVDIYITMVILVILAAMVLVRYL